MKKGVYYYLQYYNTLNTVALRVVYHKKPIEITLQLWYRGFRRKPHCQAVCDCGINIARATGCVLTTFTVHYRSLPFNKKSFCARKLCNTPTWGGHPHSGGRSSPPHRRIWESSSRTGHPPGMQGKVSPRGMPTCIYTRSSTGVAVHTNSRINRTRLDWYDFMCLPASCSA